MTKKTGLEGALTFAPGFNIKFFMCPSTILSTMAHFPFCIKYGLHFLTSLHCKNWGLVSEWALRILSFVQDWQLPLTDNAQWTLGSLGCTSFVSSEHDTPTKNVSPILWTFRSDWKSKCHKSIYALSGSSYYYLSFKTQLKGYILIFLYILF